VRPAMQRCRGPVTPGDQSTRGIVWRAAVTAKSGDQGSRGAEKADDLTERTTFLPRHPPARICRPYRATDPRRLKPTCAGTSRRHCGTLADIRITGWPMPCDGRLA